MRMNRSVRVMRNTILLSLLFFMTAVVVNESFATKPQLAPEAAPAKIVSITINGTINPASDDFLKRSIEVASQQKAALLIVNLNTPGGLLTSMQTMVEAILGSPVPVAVYVTPSGGSATSAGVFITMAGHFAAMAPGTTIGAAHPVQGGGEDVGEDMQEKVVNFTVSLVKAVAEQRGRNVKWAEKSVRDSVSITDKEAVKEKVVDFIAKDTADLLQQIEGKKIAVAGKEVVVAGVVTGEIEQLEMTFRQMVVNILSDPNIAILIGLAAMLGLGIEFYNPGLILPGVVGAVCLILSLTAAQVLPINYGGVALLVLAVIFIGIELNSPSFGIWGGAGLISLILGSIYVVDTEQVWSVDGFSVDMAMISTIAGTVGVLLLLIAGLVARDARRKVETGREGLIGKTAVVKDDFKQQPQSDHYKGRVVTMGENWQALYLSSENPPKKGEELKVVRVEGLKLVVDRK